MYILRSIYVSIYISIYLPGICFFVLRSVFLSVVPSFDVSSLRYLGLSRLRPFSTYSLPGRGGAPSSLFHPLRLASSGREYGSTTAAGTNGNFLRSATGQQDLGLIIPGCLMFAGEFIPDTES